MIYCSCLILSYVLAILPVLAEYHYIGFLLCVRLSVRYGRSAEVI
jgi:hypothetical protein